MSILNGQSLLAGAMAGLSDTYATLMNSSSSSGKGLTLNDLSNVSTETIAKIGTNYNFLQYLTTNFKSLDNDGDGELTGNDLNTMMSTMQSKGLTYNEIQSLCASGNANSSLCSTVLQYFNKIDTNGDGRITSDEITKFSFECQRDEALQKYKSYKATSASLYYNDGVEDDTSSVLDTLRPNVTGSSENS